jgi:hypothetical protein
MATMRGRRGARNAVSRVFHADVVGRVVAGRRAVPAARRDPARTTLPVRVAIRA